MNNFDSIIKACSYLLANAPEAEDCRTYLNNRLLSDTQAQFSFGYMPNAENLSLLSNLISDETLKGLNLLYTREFQDSNSPRAVNVCFFENHPLIMPYRDVYGNIMALVGRSLFSDEERQGAGISKYKNTHFIKGNHLFGLYEAKKHILKAGYVYIVEGQFDVIKAWEKGLKNVVAVGSSDLSAYQLALVCRYTHRIKLLLDNDEAGNKGKERALKKYGGLAEISSVSLPVGYKDLDEYLNGNGAEGIENL